MIRPDVLDRFAETFGRAGFDRTAFMPSYGMAEVCLAITFSPHGTGVRTDMSTAGFRRSAQPAADPDDRARALRALRQGAAGPSPGGPRRAPAGCSATARSAGSSSQGPSVMPGYFGEPEATREVLSPTAGSIPATSATGCDGEIVVTGRAKDLIIVNGRNIWPQDIEWAVEARRDREERRFGGLLGRQRRGRAGRRGGAGARVGRGGAQGAGARRRAAPCARRSRSIATSCWCRRRWACRRPRRASSRARAPRPTTSPASTRPSTGRGLRPPRRDRA